MSRIVTGRCPNCGLNCRKSTDNTVDCLECGFYSEIHPVGNYHTLEELNEMRHCEGYHPLSQLPEQNFLL